MEERNRLHPEVDEVHLANEEAVRAVPAITEGKTVGVSPKVAWPTLVGIAAGVVIMLFIDVNTGLTVLLAALGYGGIGAGVKPGTVEQR